MHAAARKKKKKKKTLNINLFKDSKVFHARTKSKQVIYPLTSHTYIQHPEPMGKSKNPLILNEILYL